MTAQYNKRGKGEQISRVVTEAIGLRKHLKALVNQTLERLLALPQL